MATSAKPLKNFTLHLDEGFDCPEVRAALDRAGIKYISLSNSFPSGTEDSKILEVVGKRGWTRITLDRNNRYRHIEKDNILRFRVRQFVFRANLGGHALANLLVTCYPRMREFARLHGRPFVAHITKGGTIHLRLDKDGQTSHP